MQKGCVEASASIKRAERGGKEGQGVIEVGSDRETFTASGHSRFVVVVAAGGRGSNGGVEEAARRAWEKERSEATSWTFVPEMRTKDDGSGRHKQDTTARSGPPGSALAMRIIIGWRASPDAVQAAKAILQVPPCYFAGTYPDVDKCVHGRFTRLARYTILSQFILSSVLYPVRILPPRFGWVPAKQHGGTCKIAFASTGVFRSAQEPRMGAGGCMPVGSLRKLVILPIGRTRSTSSRPRWSGDRARLFWAINMTIIMRCPHPPVTPERRTVEASVVLPLPIPSAGMSWPGSCWNAKRAALGAEKHAESVPDAFLVSIVKHNFILGSTPPPSTSDKSHASRLPNLRRLPLNLLRSPAFALTCSKPPPMALDSTTLHNKYNLLNLSISSSTKISSRTTAITKHLSSQNSDSKENKKALIALTAPSKTASKSISIAEISKREFLAKGEKCFQYNALSSKMVEMPRKGHVEDEEEDDDDDEAFELLHEKDEDDERMVKRKRKVPVLTIYLAKSSVKDVTRVTGWDGSVWMRADFFGEGSKLEKHLHTLIKVLSSTPGPTCRFWYGFYHMLLLRTHRSYTHG
ncbi:uncharacterized protein MYCFIDRAFT_207137 [Pseudocercospora fijiensis CIRAD86]|uniref:Uncharacterized protein n=1 Tax=Pseudocercospora fijiensis (strain CIRAD86) TaxID=383855 RepID=M3B3R1_PSEFD|nr:uncharacterized protein MYCFIDRAFT_207137 [Pseudocercospora fijiensis CIRAD86]EME84023.1 hypothetical protein MYCFIDRAFT_207137 [Pseudocercospora fijiensis CIRAD86]